MERRRTKIIATLGPSTMSRETVRSMIKAGVNAFRVNFSHGSYEEVAQLLEAFRGAAQELNTYLPLIADLQGPTVRLGDFEPFNVNVERTYEVSPTGEIPVSEPEFYKMLEAGDVIAIDGGRLWARVVERSGQRALVKFLNEGTLGPRKTVAIQGKEYPFSIPTEKDVRDMEFALKNGFDGLALSFVKGRDDVKRIRGLAEGMGKPFIVAKIETISAVNNIKEIADEADYVLVARGDLGSHYPMVKIPELERTIIEEALNAGKPSIVATQLLESMINSPIPTRAEVMDVFMAVSMGADALMVSGETAVGKYPVEVVKWLGEIAEEAEHYIRARPRAKGLDVYDRFSQSVVELSETIGATIVAVTTTGKTPQRLAKFRPSSRIIAVCSEKWVCKKLYLTWGVEVAELPHTGYDQEVIEGLKNLGLLSRDERIVMTRSLKQGVTDAIKIYEI